MSKVLVCWLAISTCKLIREVFCPNSVNVSGEIAPSDRSTSSFDSPHGLGKCTDSCRRIKYDLRTVESVAHPIKWVVSAVADIDRHFTEVGFKNLCRYNLYIYLMPILTWW